MSKRIFFVLFFILLSASTSAAAEQIKLLSDNTLTSSDYGLYDKCGVSLIPFPTGADYAWTENSDGELISTDTNFSKMTGGNILNHASAYVANSKWNSSVISAAVFDLKDTYIVNRVDVWSTSTKNIQLGKVSVSVSLDGINYTDVGEWQAEVPNAELIEQDSYGQALSHTVCDFNGIKARFVKVSGGRADKTALNSTCYQYTFGEILIFGDENIELNPRVESLSFTDNNGDRIYTFNSNGTYFAKAVVRDTDACLIAACYDKDGRMKGVSIENDCNENNREITNKIVIENWESGDYLKAFAVNSINDMTPIGTSKTLREIDITRAGLLSSNTPRTNDMYVYDVSEGYDWVTEGSKATHNGFIGNESGLFDGDISKAVNIESENSAYANIKIHFNDTMKIERITVYAAASKDSYMSEYDIYASVDGYNYEYVTTKQNTISANINRIMPVTINIDEVLYASDIKLAAKKSDAVKELAIAEIEIFGKPPQFGRERIKEYSYEQEVPFKSNDDIVNADGNNEMLSDGDINTSIVSEGEYVSIIYNAKDFYQIENIDIYGHHSGCEVLTSPDGVNYFGVGFYPETDGVTKASGKANNNAKYVKFVFRKGGLDRISLSEINIYARRLYDKNAEKNTQPEKVSVKAALKPNNILYLDWSGYNQEQNNVSGYKVFIEESTFTSTLGKSLKQVYCMGNQTPTSIVEEQFCIYAGLEPDKDYYIAVTPIANNISDSSAIPTKIHTYSATGGEKLSGIFCINEYIYGGAAHVTRTGENSPISETENLQIKLKLINDMEIFSKTRYWENNEKIFNTYMSRGLGFHQYVRSEQEVELCNKYGIFSFCSSNEPDLNDTYKNNPQMYTEITKKNYDIKQSVNSKNILGEASICGTDKLNFVEELYLAEPNYGKYYDKILILLRKLRLKPIKK